MVAPLWHIFLDSQPSTDWSFCIMLYTCPRGSRRCSGRGWSKFHGETRHISGGDRCRCSVNLSRIEQIRSNTSTDVCVVEVQRGFKCLQADNHTYTVKVK